MVNEDLNNGFIGVKINYKNVKKVYRKHPKEGKLTVHLLT
jgi:hypothetical protein